MVGTIGTEPGDRGALEKAVHDELVALRGAQGRLTIQKFSHYEALRRVCGGGDLFDAFVMFEREMRRYIAHGNRDEAAAALSITADADTVTDRLVEVIGHFEGDELSKDQRTARRWSDEGLKTIAPELVYLAEIRGRLGGELLTIELAGTAEDGLSMVLWHLTAKNLPDRAPLVRFWQVRHDDGFEQDRSVLYDLDQVEAPEASSAVYRLKRYHFHIDLPKNLAAAVVTVGEAVYRISIEGRDAPMRTVSFMDDGNVVDGLSIRFTTYRTHATIELVKTK
jgi:hypothetical protein